MDENSLIYCHSFFHVNKCKSVSYGRCIEYACEYTVSDTVIDKVDKIKDLGIVFDSRLKFEEHNQHIDAKIIEHIRC